MYRVELKAEAITRAFKRLFIAVPNVPCGVERHEIAYYILKGANVPNVPCGVESVFSSSSVIVLVVFLMYRVELKGNSV